MDNREYVDEDARGQIEGLELEIEELTDTLDDEITRCNAMRVDLAAADRKIEKLRGRIKYRESRLAKAKEEAGL